MHQRCTLATNIIKYLPGREQFKFKCLEWKNSHHKYRNIRKHRFEFEISGFVNLNFAIDL